VLPPFWQRFVTRLDLGLLAMSSDILIGYTQVPFGTRPSSGSACTARRRRLTSSRRVHAGRSTAQGGRRGDLRRLLRDAPREIYFSISTLVFSQIFYVIIFTWTVTGGENGLFSQPALAIPGFERTRFTLATFHWLCCGGALSYSRGRRITLSPFGMVLQSTSENEGARGPSGITERYKMAVMLGAVGLAGVLYAVQNKPPRPTSSTSSCRERS
jgi:hypothetical protein